MLESPTIVEEKHAMPPKALQDARRQIKAALLQLKITEI